MTGEPKPLTPGLRRASIAALVLGALVGFGAAQGMAQTLEPHAAEVSAASTPAFGGLDAELSRQVAEVGARAWLRSFESMRSSRVAILMALSIAASLFFVSSIRMLRPSGVPREGVRRLLVGSALVCAVLRTLDGAQLTAAAKRAGAALDKFALDEAVPGWPAGLFGPAFMLVSVGQTVLVAGAFALLYGYFRSERVREAVGGDVEPPPGDD